MAQGHIPQTHTRAPPAHMQAPPKPKEHSPWTNATMQHGNAIRSKNLLTLSRAVKPPAWASQTALWNLTARGRLDCPKKPALHKTFQNLPETLQTPFKCSQVPKIMYKLLPLVDNAWIKAKFENIQPRASQIDNIHHKMLHMSKWAR
jgi:hypothetical protein